MKRKLFIRIHNLVKTREFILVKNSKDCSKIFSVSSYFPNIRGKKPYGKKPYEYKECGKAFNYYSYFNDRQRIYTGENLMNVKYVEKPLLFCI
jgi:hypothetical protein